MNRSSNAIFPIQMKAIEIPGSPGIFFWLWPSATAYTNYTNYTDLHEFFLLATANVKHQT